MGRAEGLTAAEIRALDPAAFDAWMADVGRFQFPGGESLGDVAARVWPALEAIEARHAGGAVLVVAHGGPNRIVLCRALGVPVERILSLGQDYAALSVMERNRDGWRLYLLNHQEPCHNAAGPPPPRMVSRTSW
jgi:broad specificity phosphatase PhoE